MVGLGAHYFVYGFSWLPISSIGVLLVCIIEPSLYFWDPRLYGMNWSFALQSINDDV